MSATLHAIGAAYMDWGWIIMMLLGIPLGWVCRGWLDLAFFCGAILSIGMLAWYWTTLPA